MSAEEQPGRPRVREHDEADSNAAREPAAAETHPADEDDDVEAHVWRAQT
jgi:hypothetical protein